MTLAISMLKNIFPLHTKMQYYHLMYPMCYSISYNVEFFFQLKKLLVLTNGIELAISGCDI